MKTTSVSELKKKLFFKTLLYAKMEVKNSIHDSLCKKQVMFSRKYLGGFREHTIKIYYGKFQAIL